MRHVVLTPRQFQVARLLSQGMTYKELGEQLGISARTVERHAAELRRRTGARTNAAAVSRAPARAPSAPRSETRG